MNPPSFSLSDILVPVLKKALQKPLQKAATWAYRQDDGKTHGDAVEAQNAPFVDAAVGAIAGDLAQTALSQVGAAHLTADKMAKSLGIPTTEEGLIAAGVGQAGQGGVLNLSDPAAALSFLAQNLVK